MRWMAYVPESGNWDITYVGNNARKARACFREMMSKVFGYKRLPSGTRVFRDPDQ